MPAGFCRGCASSPRGARVSAVGEAAAPPIPTLAAAIEVWAKVGCLSFGGPAGQIALLHREVVERRAWVSDRRFLQALNFCTLLPGPEATQLAIYLGWLMHGGLGGAAAGLLFVVPGAALMMALSIGYALLGAVPAVAALFLGLKAAVLAVVADALLRVARRALVTRVAWITAGLAFAALFLFAAPFPLVVLAAGLAGYSYPHEFAEAHGTRATDDAPAALDAALAADPGLPARRAASARRAGIVSLIAWVAPPALLAVAGGGVLADLGIFFSKLAVVTFGGAYAVLAYAAQAAVEQHHWVTPGQMLDGLGLAETTPGPLILVVQFVGFLAAYHVGGLWLGVAGALLTLWVTFAPSFAFVFLGAPLVERLQRQRSLAGALSAITAAVVGVIANLSLWFALHTLFTRQIPVRAWPLHVDAPVPASLDLVAVGLAAVGAVSLFRLRLGVVRTLGVCALASLLAHLAGIA